VIVPADERVTASVSCAPDEVATGGVMSLGDNINTVNPSYSEGGNPGTQPNEWGVSYNNPGPSVVFLSASVECAKLVDVP
jgi:hypothetical protein